MATSVADLYVKQLSARELIIRRQRQQETRNNIHVTGGKSCMLDNHYIRKLDSK